jgi:hypothetical protein
MLNGLENGGDYACTRRARVPRQGKSIAHAAAAMQQDYPAIAVSTSRTQYDVP